MEKGEKKLKCPLRKEGNNQYECWKEKCAWWNRDKCAVLSICTELEIRNMKNNDPYN